jgi:hypothetical protein
MSPDDLERLIRQRPFVPLRLYMSNGRTHEVRHPETAIIGDEVVAIGVHEDEGRRPRITLLSLININEIQPIEQSAIGG